MTYKDLTVKERHALIKAGVANGVHKLSEIESRYNDFVKRYEYGFDIDSFVRENPGAVFSTNPGEHLTDKYKLPNHPTFSTKSDYHSEATPGGTWTKENGVDLYTPSDYVLNMQGGWNNFLRGFYSQEQGTGAVPVFDGGVMLPEVEVRGHRFDEGGQANESKTPTNSSTMLQPVRYDLSYGNSYNDQGTINDLQSGAATYDFKPQNVVDFFNYDVAPRFQRTNPQATEFDLSAIRGAVNTAWEPGNFNNRNGRYTLATSKWTVGRSPVNTFNPNYTLTDDTIVHEDTHAYRNGVFRATHLLNEETPIQGFENPVNYDYTGYSPAEQQLLDSAYPNWLAADSERGTTNTELRFNMWNTLKNNLGRVPTVEELDSFIDNLSDDELMGYLKSNDTGYSINGYMRNYLGDIFSNPYNSEEYQTSLILKKSFEDSLEEFNNSPLYRLRHGKTKEERKHWRDFLNEMIDEYNERGKSIKESGNAYNKEQLKKLREAIKYVAFNQQQNQGNAYLAAEGGKIHIAPSKRGTFTAAATKHGKSVQAFASQVLAHKENYSPAMVKKANFARNAAGWKHSTGGPMYPFSFSKKPLPAVRYAGGGKLVQPAEQSGQRWGFGINGWSQALTRDRLARGTRQYDTQNQNVRDFYTLDVTPRYQREHPEATEEELAALSSGLYTAWGPQRRDNQNLATNWHNNDGTVVFNEFNPEYMLSNPTIVHEDIHASRQGALGAYDPIYDEDSGEQIGYRSRYGYDASGYSVPEQEALRNAYNLPEDLGYKAMNEQGASNTELRYRIWRDMRDSTGTTPTIQELDAYIDNMSNEDLERYITTTNSYLNQSWMNGEFFSDAYKDAGYNRLLEINQEYGTANRKRRKELLREANEIKRGLQSYTPESKYNFDSVKEALKKVASEQRNIEGLV